MKRDMQNIRRRVGSRETTQAAAFLDAAVLMFFMIKLTWTLHVLCGLGGVEASVTRRFERTRPEQEYFPWQPQEGNASAPRENRTVREVRRWVQAKSDSPRPPPTQTKEELPAYRGAVARAKLLNEHLDTT